MTQSTLTYIKLGVVAIAVVGVFGMAIAGRISPDVAVNDVGLVVAGLLGALGLSSAGSAIGSAMRAKAGGATEIKP